MWLLIQVADPGSFFGLWHSGLWWCDRDRHIVVYLEGRIDP